MITAHIILAWKSASRRSLASDTRYWVKGGGHFRMLTLPKLDLDFAKYSQFGDYHWQEYANGTIYGHHAKKIAAWVRERPVLDVGCGDGLITYLLGEGAEGIDPILLAVDMAKRHGVNAKLGRLESVEGWWPAVYFGDVLEHIEDQKAAVDHLARI